MTRANFVKAARKDYPEAGVKKGESYWWWKFNFSRYVHRSKVHPTRSQLTQSGFLQELYDIEDNLSFDGEDLESSVQELTERIQELADQCQESLDNMPDHLQESSETGMLLQERIDALEAWISDLEGVDLSVDDVEDITLDEEEQTEVLAVDVDDLTAEDYAAMPEGLEGDALTAAVEALIEAKREARALELKEEKRQERIDEIIEELEGFSSGL